MLKQTQELRSQIHHFLDAHVLTKPEGDRTKLEDLVVETGRTFADALLRFCHDPSISSVRAADMREADKDVTSLLRSYNEINRREVDIAAISMIRNPLE